VSVAFHEKKSRQHANDETNQADADIPPEWVETPNGHVASVDEYWSR